MELIENPYLYGLGVLIAYLIIKLGRKKLGITIDWGVIFGSLFLSIFSWFCVMAITIIFVVHKVNDLKIKPPRWL